MSQSNTKKKKCIICGCPDHRIFGCIAHWTGHKKTGGKCISSGK